jgi:hypothetical protein
VAGPAPQPDKDNGAAAIRPRLGRHLRAEPEESGQREAAETSQPDFQEGAPRNGSRTCRTAELRLESHASRIAEMALGRR